MISGSLRHRHLVSLPYRVIKYVSRRTLVTVTKPGAYGQPLPHSHPHLGELFAFGPYVTLKKVMIMIILSRTT